MARRASAEAAHLHCARCNGCFAPSAGCSATGGTTCARPSARSRAASAAACSPAG